MSFLKPFLILSSLFSGLNTLALLVGGIWLAIDGVWSAILIGLCGAVGVAFLLSLAMTFALFLAAPASIALKRGWGKSSYLLLMPSVLAAGYVMTSYYGFVYEYFSEYTPRTHVVAVLLWSYAVSMIAIAMIKGNDTTERMGMGLFWFFCNLSYVTAFILAIFQASKEVLFGVPYSINVIGFAWIMITSVYEKNRAVDQLTKE